MSWTVITADLVRSQVTAAEMAAAQEVSQESGQSDPVVNQIQWATDLVRGYCRKVVDMEATGVPPALVESTVIIVCYKLLLRTPGELWKRFEKAYEEALALLDKVAKGEIDVSDTTSSVGPSITANEKLFTRENLDGI